MGDWGRTSPSCIGHAFTMPTTLPLLRENVTYEEARQRETNTLHQLTYPKAQLEFYNFLYRRQILIQKRVAHHLNVPSSTCQVAAPKDWMQGSFNLCIPVTLADSKRVLIRFPLPYRVGDKVCPGNADEKVRCEAATYVWMQKECRGSQFLASMDLPSQAANALLQLRIALCSPVYYVSFDIGSCLGSVVLFPPT